MSGLFQALEIGKRALPSHRTAINTIAHSVAKINTSCYNRQGELLKSAHPPTTGDYMPGNGVAATGNVEVLRNQTENSKELIQGVSLEKKMAEMVRQQHAYDAAARVITYIDDALDTLISGMGVIGR